jgi:AcrR family transcriptional regulator
VEGLNGLSMAHLADALQISKSGVHALFGTKEDLQLATVAAARRRFVAVVVAPVFDETEGLPRLRALVDSWLEYVRRREFPGGCFVTRWSAEFASHPGRVRDALRTARSDWLQLIAIQLSVAGQRGELAGCVDPEQLAFEIDGMLVAGNNGALLGDDTALDRAARGVASALATAEARSSECPDGEVDGEVDMSRH